jgi:uncharacterized membrane protein YkvA (DUF1232 family)
VNVLITIVVGIIVTFVVLWLVLLIGLAWLHPTGSTLRDAARIVPDTARLVHRLTRDHSLGRGVRVRLLLLLAYLAFPIDLVPDIIPVLGYADDAIVVGVVLRSVMRHVGPESFADTGPAALRASWCSHDSAGYRDSATINDTRESDERGHAQSDLTHSPGRRDVLNACPGLRTNGNVMPVSCAVIGTATRRRSLGRVVLCGRTRRRTGR